MIVQANSTQKASVEKFRNSIFTEKQFHHSATQPFLHRKSKNLKPLGKNRH